MTGTTTQGTRRPDGTAPHLLAPGEYALWTEDGTWYGVAPTDPALLAWLANHTVVEHEDGTISAAPSIRVDCGGKHWHGYLERGVWRKA